MTQTSLWAHRAAQALPPAPLPQGGNVSIGPPAFQDKLEIQNWVSRVLRVQVSESFRDAVEAGFPVG